MTEKNLPTEISDSARALKEKVKGVYTRKLNEAVADLNTENFWDKTQNISSLVWGLTQSWSQIEAVEKRVAELEVDETE